MSSSICSCVLKPNPLENGGVVSVIVGSNCDRSGRSAAATALMSSNNWLSINKREEEQEDDDKDEDDDELMKRKPGQDEVWKAIQAQKQQQGDNGDHNNNKVLPIRSTVSWNAILLSDQKVDVQVQDSPPYIHPLLRKSSSCCLSKQSLQICTESLGSETGSDCLSSQTHEDDIFNDVKMINYSKKSPSPPPSSFPPPLPSLANSSVHLRSHRQGKGEGGRLILEAVSIPQHNYFHAERSHGRLLLTALKSPGSPHQQQQEEEEAGDNSSSDDGSDNEDEEELSQLEEESSMVAGEGEGAADATTPSLNSNTNHSYWNSGSSSIAEYKQQQQQKGEEEGLIPLLRNCKEARRRSLLTWEPPNYCIATSS